MWNCPSKEELSKLKPIGTYDGVAAETPFPMKFFLANFTWYVLEYDQEDDIIFGYVQNDAMPDCSEWGTTSMQELRELKARGVFEVDRDMYWTPKTWNELHKAGKV